MECPVCKVTLLMSEKQGIEIDYCPTCRGIWLDRGELEKIIERSDLPEDRQNIPPEPGGPYFEKPYNSYKHDSHDSYRHDSHGYKYGRKKSFLSELFD